MQDDASSNESALPFVRMVLAANDREHIFWPPENRQFAEKILLKTRGGVPAIEDIIGALGKERFQSLLTAIIEKRKFDNLCLGYHSPCHYCGKTEDLSRLDFSLMRVIQSGRNWGGTAASLALSAALLPIIGGAVVKLPGKSSHGPAIHLRLIVCATCRKREGGLFGFVLTAKSAAKHPLWEQLVSAGFTKFLVRETMPMEFKTMSHMHL